MFLSLENNFLFLKTILRRISINLIGLKRTKYFKIIKKN